MPKVSKENVQTLTAEHFITQTTPYNVRNTTFHTPVTPQQHQINMFNGYHNLMTTLFTYEHIMSDLINRLMIGCNNSGIIKLGRIPFAVYDAICKQNSGKRKRDTYRTVHRELGSYRIAHVNYAFDGFVNMPKFGGTGGWAMKILNYQTNLGDGQIGVSSYRLYYTKLHFFYNMERSLLEAKFSYQVEYYNKITNKWEAMAAPKNRRSNK